MTANKKATGTAMSMPAGLARGAVGSLIVTILSAVILAKLLESETIPESSTGYGIMILLVLASYVGAMISSQKIKRRRPVVCILSGVIYMAILLGITALFFGGQYQAVGVTALLVLCGIGLAVLTGAQKLGQGRKRISKIYHR